MLREALIALAVATLAGCGDDGSLRDEPTLDARPNRTACVTDNIDGHPGPTCPATPTATPPTYLPATAGINCLTINNTPVGECRTRTPAPSHDELTQTEAEALVGKR